MCNMSYETYDTYHHHDIHETYRSKDLWISVDHEMTWVGTHEIVRYYNTHTRSICIWATVWSTDSIYTVLYSTVRTLILVWLQHTWRHTQYVQHELRDICAVWYTPPHEIHETYGYPQDVWMPWDTWWYMVMHCMQTCVHIDAPCRYTLRAHRYSASYTTPYTGGTTGYH